MKDEDLLHTLESEVALLKKRVEILKELLLQHLTKKSEIEEFKEKLDEY